MHTGEAHRELLESGKLFGSSVMASFGVDMDLSGDSDAIMDIMELPEPIVLAGRETGWLGFHNYCYDPSMAPKGKSVIGAILMSDVATPLTFARYTDDWKGTYMTWTLSREYQ